MTRLKSSKPEQSEPKKQEAASRFKHYWMCTMCAKTMGGVFPEGHVCTVTRGNCPYCGQHDTLIPWVDFNWPDKRTNFRAQVVTKKSLIA